MSDAFEDLPNHFCTNHRISIRKLWEDLHEAHKTYRSMSIMQNRQTCNSPWTQWNKGICMLQLPPHERSFLLQAGVFASPCRPDWGRCVGWSTRILLVVAVEVFPIVSIGELPESCFWWSWCKQFGSLDGVSCIGGSSGLASRLPALKPPQYCENYHDGKCKWLKSNMKNMVSIKIRKSMILSNRINRRCCIDFEVLTDFRALICLASSGERLHVFVSMSIRLYTWV